MTLFLARGVLTYSEGVLSTYRAGKDTTVQWPLCPAAMAEDQVALVLEYLKHSRADVRALASENIAALSGSADGLRLLKRADVQRQLCEAVGDVEGAYCEWDVVSIDSV